MHNENIHTWQHGHTFGQELRRPGESRTLIVIGITVVMMVVELVAGTMFGSMALLADGLHMASHAVALSVSAFAYVYARRNAGNPRFSFGTGKVNALGGFTGALLLAVFALFMAVESVGRLLNPIEIILIRQFSLLCWACWLMASVCLSSASETTTIAMLSMITAITTAIIMTTTSKQHTYMSLLMRLPLSWQ